MSEFEVAVWESFVRVTVIIAVSIFTGGVAVGFAIGVWFI